MRKLILSCALCALYLSAIAGGLVTNQNQSAAYIRMLARGASTGADAVFYNPAGAMAFADGFTLSFSNQFVWQSRTISDANPALNHSEFKGSLQVPFFPSLYAAYKTGDWTISLGFNPTAGGGSVKFDEGLPMIESPLSMLPASLTAAGIPVSRYSLQSSLDGTSISYGVQAGVTYKIGEVLGVYGGLRMLMTNNKYEGHLTNVQIDPRFPPAFTGGMVPAQPFFSAASAYFSSIGQAAAAAQMAAIATQVADQRLDVKQKGTGFTPVIGAHLRLGALDLGVKYEFNTSITVKNNTASDVSNMFPDGLELRADVPAVLSIGLGYDIVPQVKMSFTYLQYFDKQSNMESWNSAGQTKFNKMNFIEKNTREIMAGAEWKASEKLLLSLGYQFTLVYPSDVYGRYQSDISHSLSNYSMGLGAAYKICNNLTVNIGALATIYDKFKVNADNFERIYDRSTQNIAVGIDYCF